MLGLLGAGVSPLAGRGALEKILKNWKKLSLFFAVVRKQQREQFEIGKCSAIGS